MSGVIKQKDGNEKALVYSEFPVDRAVADYVLCGWSFVATEDLRDTYAHHVLPDGCISLVFRVGSKGNQGPLIVSGPHVKELRVDVHAGNQYWGVKFWPDAGGAILDLAPVECRGRADLMVMRCPSYGQVLSSLLSKCAAFEDALRVFQDFVATRKESCPPLDVEVRQGVLAINQCDGAEEISKIVSKVGLSQRQFQRRFQSCVGLTPKEYSRIRRMRVALTKGLEERQKGWAAVAIEAGYADQSHLSRDAAALTGLSPVGFEDRVRPIDHRNVDP
jgi:AraC-like DNA-binding protein